MKRSTLHCLALLAAASLCVAAEPEEYGWRVNGVLVPDEPWRGHDGPFLAQLIVTDEAAALYEAWNTKPGNVRVRHVAKVAPGTAVEAVVFFVGCQADSEGNCQVWGTATVEASDTGLLADAVEIPLWVGRPPLPRPALGIAEKGVGMVVEESAGSYTFRIVVTDRIAGRKVQLVQRLAVGSP